MKLRKNEVISPKNFFFLPRKSEFPRELFEKFLGENQNNRNDRKCLTNLSVECAGSSLRMLSLDFVLPL